MFCTLRRDFGGGIVGNVIGLRLGAFLGGAVRGDYDAAPGGFVRAGFADCLCSTRSSPARLPLLEYHPGAAGRRKSGGRADGCHRRDTARGWSALSGLGLYAAGVEIRKGDKQR